MTYLLGLDFGSLSARAIVVDAATGRVIGRGEATYILDQGGLIEDENDPNFARQSPKAYRVSLKASVHEAISELDSSQIAAIGVGTTGSTPIPVDSSLVPIADHPKFKDHPAAQAWMWKDHTAFAEADEITASISAQSLPYLSLSGGTYSSEWFWAKLLRCARTAPGVFAASHIWLELQDYIPALLCGHTRTKDVVPGICAAGHKGLYSESWGGFPSASFLDSLHPGLSAMRDRLAGPARPSSHHAGMLCTAWAETLGLRDGIPVTVGCLDAHAGAVGSGVAPGRLIKMVGTSTCDIAISDRKANKIGSDGICGTVDGSVVPGWAGLEAGQAAVGDLFAWAGRLFDTDLTRLTEEAQRLTAGQSGLLALDWNNGNRSVLMNSRLSGLIIGQNLQTTPAEIFRALIEATAFGGRMILERFEGLGANVDEVILCGGVVQKSALVCQTYADVMNRPMRLDTSENSAALGAAMLAGVAAGIYTDVTMAQACLGTFDGPVTHPNPEASKTYDILYSLYGRLTDGFGRSAQTDLSDIMKSLLTLRDETRHG